VYGLVDQVVVGNCTYAAEFKEKARYSEAKDLVLGWQFESVGAYQETRLVGA
jgi:hypothetical protein